MWSLEALVEQMVFHAELRASFLLGFNDDKKGPGRCCKLNDDSSHHSVHLFTDNELFTREHATGAVVGRISVEEL